MLKKLKFVKFYIPFHFQRIIDINFLLDLN